MNLVQPLMLIQNANWRLPPVTFNT